MSFNEAQLKDLLGGKGYIRGPFGSALKRAELKEDGVPVYEQQHAIRGDRDFRYFIDEEKYEKLKRFTVETNDLIISCSGTVGRISVIREGDPKGIISQALLILRPDAEKVLPEYLYYFFSSKRGFNELINASQGAVQLNIAPRAVVEKIPVPIPCIEEQKTIVAILKGVDDKIELNRQTNQTLEQIAQAIFKSWFVDFEPTRAKIIAKEQGADSATQELAAQAIICGAITLEQLQGYAEENVEESAQQREQESLSTRLQKAINEKLSQASANPLNATTAEQLIATAALFPSALVESELGEVPEGWELKPFSEYAKVTKGKNITKKNAVPGNVPVVAGGLLPAYWHNAHNVEGPVITISASGANAGYVNLYNQNIWSSDSSYIDKKSTSYFYTAYVCLKYYQKAIYGMQTGAAQPHIYPKDFERLNVVFGSDKLLEQLENLLFSFFEKTANLTNEAETLTQIRDTLLPKLLSGEITLAEEVKRS